MRDEAAELILMGLSTTPTLELSPVVETIADLISPHTHFSGRHMIPRAFSPAFRLRRVPFDTPSFP